MIRPDDTAGRRERVAHRLEVHGTVQGVGFRPFVYRLGTSLGLDGWVRNDDGRVVIEAAGPPGALAALASRLRTDAPPLARVRDVRVTELSARIPRPRSGFRVGPSTGRPAAPASAPTSASASASHVREVPADVATCEACLAELFDPNDRRYRYPFVNCADCGPRATIVDTLPYDRTRTTMRAFPMCDDCAREYTDPGDRRFHAEPIACPACGPQLAWWAPAGGRGPRTDPQPAASTAGSAALAAAVAMIDSGGTVALKGLGGYQLVCDATNGAAVARLRARKHRPTKPFAVMVTDLDAARALADIDTVEAGLLTSVARPVVLLRRAHDGVLAGAVGASAPRLGLFLPATPLHQLLLGELGRPLVVTSGNSSGEPIVIDDAEARDRLATVADGFLSHDRAIRSPYDDSVVRVVAGRGSMIRRARGYAPRPLRLPVSAGEPLLAVGAQLKHTFTLAEGTTAVVGPHTGDLSQQPTLMAFERSLAHLCAMTGITPRVIVHDPHPGYLSTQYALSSRYAMMSGARPRVAVQHHHAHVASCAAEHGVTGRFIGVAYDGLGLGDDGTLWGGEVLVADLVSYRRVARFGRAPLPGGTAALRRPARVALGYLFGAEPLGGVPAIGTSATGRRLAAPFLDRLTDREVSVAARMIERGVNCPVASSAGRLFDAVAALLGLCEEVTYEGEAAAAVEAAALAAATPAVSTPGPAAAGHARAVELPWRIVGHGGLLVYDPRPTLRALVEGLHARVAVGVLAARFHATIVAVTVALCTDAARRHRLRTVCLSGGVMHNQLLAETLPAALAAAGLTPLLNERVPAGDGGVSYGQAAVAAARLRGE
ncbi:carbamoyltransferase HypF [Frankia sp. CiP3]|uniref:carbamoyltransferase HypF n=1 Tax=Frankia sp. CiP3 TaxID=2880971 RepID=UPI001EF4CCF9|nr:carbamoyltransferase HypF [Frankia sp. CiP3]